MCVQAMGNGQWNMILLRQGIFALSFRHLVPLVFVLYLIISVVAGIFGVLFGTFALVSYVCI